MNTLVQRFINYFKNDPRELIVLRIIESGKEMYGLDIVEKSQGEISRLDIYRVLGRMTEKGLILSKKEFPLRPIEVDGIKHKILQRNLYRISSKGLTKLYG